MNSTVTMINSNKNTIEGDKTRRKRLKVVSACGECRRKKTKCNGEKPCAGCLKAHVECKYVNSPKSNNNHNKPPIPEETTPLDNTRIIMKPTPTTSFKPTTTSISIESIEERLATIENILRALLGSGKNKHLLQGLEQQQRPEPPSFTASSVVSKSTPSNSNSFYSKYSQSSPYHQSSDSLSPTTTTSSCSNPHSSSLCGDMYSSSPHLVHVPPILNRNLPREKRQRHEDECMTDNSNKKRIMIRDSHGSSSSPLLAPIKIISHQSPGIPTIKNLLNNDDDTNINHHHPSAFFRMSSHRNTAQTAAGTTN
jgi:hypothetical protein